MILPFSKTFIFLLAIVQLLSCSSSENKRRDLNRLPASIHINKSCASLIFHLIRPPREFVNSFEDFYKHTSLHVSRVNELGIWYYKRHRDKFQHINLDLVERYLKLHDKGKLDLSLSVENGNRPVLDRLYDFYSRSSGLTDQQLNQRTDLISELNSIDAEVALKFFRENGLLDESGNFGPGAKELMKIEHASDITDRVLNEVSSEEFGRKMYPLSQNLEGEEETMALELESSYLKITEFLWFSNQ